jgi:hypothetical protein
VTFLSRGLIIPPAKNITDNSFSFSANIDNVELRRYLLYWDILDFPDSGFIRFQGNPDLDFLEDAGILKRTKVQFPFHGTPDLLFSVAQAEALKINKKNLGEEWSIAQNGPKLLFPDSISTISTAIEVDLCDCLPIPATDVPLNDILEFKVKRKDELMQFRKLMDDFYSQLNMSTDILSTSAEIIAEIDYNISTLHKVMMESKIKRFLSSVKVQLISELAPIALPIFLSTQNIPMQETIGLTGIASAIRIGINYIPKLISLPDNSNYAYLYYLERELT